MLLIFLDTETTGCNPEKHCILEVAFKVYEAKTWQPLLSYSSVVQQTPEKWAEADPESLKINGFTWEEIIRGKTEKNVAAEIGNDLNHLALKEKGGVFICQNPSFDRAFFQQLLSEDTQREFGWPYHWLDLASMYWAQEIMRDPNKFISLKEKHISKNEIALFYKIPPEVYPHRALRGVEHLIACYKAIFSHQSEYFHQKIPQHE